MKKIIFISNYIYILFITFFLIIFYTLYATINISNIINDNYTNMEQIKKLEILDQNMDIVFLHKLDYINEKDISDTKQEIQKVLSNIKKIAFSIKNQPQLIEDYIKLKQSFETKIYFLDKFHIYNKKIIDYIESVLKFQKNIQKTYYFNEISNLINCSLVDIFKLIQNKKGDETHLLHTNIESIKQLYKAYSLNDRRITNFIKKLESAINGINKLNIIIDNSQKTDIHKYINTFELSMTNYYKNLQNQQKNISYVFILLSLLSFAIIIFFYENRKKLTSSMLNFSKAVENSPNSIIITDTKGVITYTNPAFTKITGYSKEEVIGKNPKILKSGNLPESFYKNIYKKINKGEQWSGVFVNRKKNGKIFYEQASITPIINRGNIESFLAIKSDITELIKNQEKLKKETKKLEDAQKITHIGSFEIHWESNKIEYSFEFKNILQLKDRKTIDYDYLLNKIYKIDRKTFKLILDSSLTSKQPFSLNHRIMDTSKRVKYVTTRCQHEYDKKGNPKVTLGTMQDTTDITISKKRVEFIAYHDLLTKFFNKEGFIHELTDYMTLAQIKDIKMALISLDIDRFKDINETLGHDIGDKVLKIVSRRLKDYIKKDGILSRFGGDEFFILINNYDDLEHVSQICKDIKSLLSKPIKLENYTIHITVSLGISLYPKDGDSASEILKNSDIAMHHAKNEGRDRYKFYDKSILEKIEQRLKIENALKYAITNSEFSLLYQPQVSPKLRQIIGAEALIRWNSKELGFVRPDIFIPIAEYSGQIIEIGEWVFQNACEGFAKLKAKNSSLKHIAINVSSIQLSQNHIAKKFQEIANQTGIKTGEIEIEITERFLMRDNNSILNSLKEMGFKISIDDFGTGYSSLNYIKSFPINTIKIDKSFIDKITVNEGDKIIIKSILNISESLNYSVIAEGVEYKEQEDTIYTIDENIIIQGYLYSKPVSIEEFPSSYSKMLKKDS